MINVRSFKALPAIALAVLLLSGCTTIDRFLVPVAATKPTQAPQRFLTKAELETLTSYNLIETLGAPVLTRREGLYEMWQFQQANCQLDLYLMIRPTSVQIHEIKYIESTLNSERPAPTPKRGETCWQVAKS